VAPAVTPTDVLSALRRVALPGLETRMQPGDRTLANLDTIFWTDPVPVDLTLMILGQPVRVAAAPASYRWVYGDGAVSVTSSPGDPYPQRTVVHRYSDAHVTVHPHVEVTYSARFQVNGGPWQDVPGTVTTVGPATDLRVVEGAALLSGAHE
jgi:hypothetical protein